MARPTGAYSRGPQGPALGRVWQSMRILRHRFTVATLVITAETGESATTKYVRALAWAGYLRLVHERVSGRPGSRNEWSLVRGHDSPLAPIVRKDGSGVFDANTGVLWGLDGLPGPLPLTKTLVARALLAKLGDQAGDEPGRTP